MASIRRELAEMRTRDRELLVRFYLENQTREQICEEMGLTETQYRLFKSRAKGKLIAAVQRRTAHRAFATGVAACA